MTLSLIGFSLCTVGCASRPESAREPAERQQEPRRLAPGEAARLIRRHNLALGHLGTEDFPAAIKLLEELQSALPEEPAVATNLTVACLLRLKSLDLAGRRGSAEQQAAIHQADQAVQRLLQAAGDEADSHLLASKVARLAGDEQRSWQELDRAVALAPADPVLWFERFQTARGSADENVRSQVAAALKRTHELAPDNLFVLVQLLWQQAADKDPAMADTVAAIRRLVEPLLVDSPRLRSRNMLVMLDQATTMIADRALDEQQKWRNLHADTRRIGNVLLAELPTRIDFRRIDRQDDRESAERALVRHDLSAGFYASVPGLVRDLGPPIPVNFNPAPQPQQLPLLPDVRDVELLDFDWNGRLEVVAVRPRAVEVYGRSQDGAPWQLAAAFQASGELLGLAAADLDRDAPRTGGSSPSPPLDQADADLIAFGPEGLVVLENHLDEVSGKRSLRAVGQDQALSRLRGVSAVGLADVDHDGDLDLVVSAAEGVSVWSNGGQFVFQDISGRSTLPSADIRPTTILPVDWNRNADIDLVLAGDAASVLGWLENRRHGRLVWQPFSADSGLEAGAAGQVCLVSSGNASRWTDDVGRNKSAQFRHGEWYLLKGGNRGFILGHAAVGPGNQVHLRPPRILSDQPLTGLATWDYDNDGYLDAVAWGEAGLSVWRGASDEQFRFEAGLISKPPGPVLDCAVGDADDDGDLDLVAATPQGVVWYVNQGGNRNHWIDVVLQPDVNPEQFPDLRINMHAVGSLLELRVGPVCQTRVVSRLPVHFGLGQTTQADVLQVHWTNGLTCTRLEPPAGQRLQVEQVLKGM